MSGPEVELRQYAESLGITALYHFTQMRNLASILQHGILPRKVLEERGLPFYFNDDVRTDQHPDATCLSISFPNYRMLYSRRCENPNIPWVIIELPPNLLWSERCAFCEANASHTLVSAKTLHERSEARALSRLFQPRVIGGARSPRIPANYPTDPQAEVLLFGTIPPAAIRCLHFETRLVLDVCFDVLSDSKIRPPKMAATAPLFNPRVDWEDWSDRRPAPASQSPSAAPRLLESRDIPF